jgi:hypothetical protein
VGPCASPRSARVGKQATPIRHGEAAGPYSEMQGFDVSSDGRRLALVEVERRGDVWLLEASEGSL